MKIITPPPHLKLCPPPPAKTEKELKEEARKRILAEVVAHARNLSW